MEERERDGDGDKEPVSGTNLGQSGEEGVYPRCNGQEGIQQKLVQGWVRNQRQASSKTRHQQVDSMTLHTGPQASPVAIRLRHNLH